MANSALATAGKSPKDVAQKQPQRPQTFPRSDTRDSTATQVPPKMASKTHLSSCGQLRLGHSWQKPTRCCTKANPEPLNVFLNSFFENLVNGNLLFFMLGEPDRDVGRTRGAAPEQPTVKLRKNPYSATLIRDNRKLQV